MIKKSILFLMIVLCLAVSGKAVIWTGDMDADWDADGLDLMILLSGLGNEFDNEDLAMFASEFGNIGLYYCIDQDNDGYGIGQECTDQDCNDGNSDIHPGAMDIPDDGFTDSNCDGIDGDLDNSFFVAVDGYDINCGTMDRPCRSITTALSLAVPGEYLLVSTGTYSETVNVKDGVSIYGGYDRHNNWARGSVTPIIVGNTVGMVARDISYNDTVINLVTVTSTNAAGATENSIGVKVIDSLSGLQFIGVTVSAGNGGNGMPGQIGSAGTPGQDGAGGGNGCDGCDAGGFGGIGGSSVCSANGGTGGRGGYWNNGDGHGDGYPGSDGIGGGGFGGTGGYKLDDLCIMGCESAGDGGNGQNGLSGSLGVHGSGGSGGYISNETWIPDSGNTGGLGGRGGGGGGGGGGGSNDCCYSDRGGGGGGGGGGGCGGTGGTGGSGGGGSFGFFLINSSPLIKFCSITSGRGGNGGAGAYGGNGGSGRSGGLGGNSADDSGAGGYGGRGGNGGDGGTGGGGAGGVSYCIYRVNSNPTFVSNVYYPGTGGLGGYGPSGNSGSRGTSGQIY